MYLYVLVILIFKILVSGANVHATTATGDTALTYACENGHTDVADVLLQAGANLVCRESSHLTVVDGILLFLLEHDFIRNMLTFWSSYDLWS